MNDLFSLLIENSNQLFQFLENNDNKGFLRYLQQTTNEHLDLNLPNEENTYLIFQVVIANNIQLTKALLHRQCRIDLIDNDNRCLLYYPIKYRYRKLIDLLLIYNKSKIGLSIVQLRDKRNKTPLFYAIRYRNTFAVHQLLFYGADPNDTNENGLNALHLAVIYQNEQLFNVLLPKIANINAQTNKGYTCLHYAVNLGLVHIVQSLLNYQAAVNLVDYTNQYIPIFFAVIQNNLIMVKLLIDRSLPNHQDNKGNTILHHSIMDKNTDLTQFILNHYSVCNRSITRSENLHNLTDNGCIQPNLCNIDGNLPLHLMMEDYSSHRFAIHMLLPATNLNLQNNEGYTNLHLIAKHQLWEALTDILQKKKLNIYVKTNTGKTVLDMIESTKQPSFLQIVYLSYLHQLMGYFSWPEKWQNNCDSNCLTHIKQTINNGYSSFPVKAPLNTVDITYHPTVNFPTFTGSSLDVLVGFKNLTIVYPQSAFAYHYTQSIPIDLAEYYRNLGIVQNNHQNLIYFDLFWVYQKLFLPHHFEQNLKQLLLSDQCHYIIYHLAIILPNGHHSNGLFYNKQTNVLERFEPHGSSYPDDFNYNPVLLDHQLHQLFYSFNNQLTYIKPASYLPKIGFQAFENTETSTNKNIGDPNGYCALWVIWYLHYRLKYNHLPARKVSVQLLKAIRLGNHSFRTIIRNYSAQITQKRDRYLQRLNKNINDYLNNRLNLKEITLLREHILNDS